MEGWREASPSSQSCQRSAWRPACGWVVARIKGVVWIEEWCALKSDKNVWHCQLWVASWQLETCSRMGTPSFQNVLMLAELKKRLLYLTLNSKYALLYTKQLGVPNWKVHGGMNSCLCVCVNVCWLEHFKPCWCRGQALPSESCLHTSWPERLVSRGLIQMMKTMKSLRRCSSRQRAHRSVDTHMHDWGDD